MITISIPDMIKDALDQQRPLSELELYTIEESYDFSGERQNE